MVDELTVTPSTVISKFVVQFVHKSAYADEHGRYVFNCKMVGCDCTRRTKIFGVSQWTRHLILKCKSKQMTDEIRLKIPKNSREKDVVLWLQRYISKKKTTRATLASRRRVPASMPSLLAVRQSQPVPQLPTKQVQTTLHDYEDVCDSNRAAAINDAVCEFLVENAIPFSVVESESFNAMTRSMNAKYADNFLPKRDYFRTTGLDR